MEEIRDLKNIKYGLIAVDTQSLDENDELEIAHFVGYWNEPTKQDVKSLREELATDKEFGLTEIIDRLEIYPAPDYIVEEFMGMAVNDNVKSKGRNG